MPSDSKLSCNLDKTQCIDLLANPALYVIDPLDTEPNLASTSGPVPTLPSVYNDLNPAPMYEPLPALPLVQRVFTSVYSIRNPLAVGGQSSMRSIPKSRPTVKGRQKVLEHAFDNATGSDNNLEATEVQHQPKPRPTGKGGKKVQEHASENAGHILETP